MSEHPPDPNQARSFDRVADAYDRGRPSYSREAARWLTGSNAVRVLELGAGTGKLTETLVALGHVVTATDPSAEMLQRLARNVPQAQVARAEAECVPLRSRSVDVVVAAQAFHWFDRERALAEVARVLRPGGTLGVVWNVRDERIPWVKRLSAIIGKSEKPVDPTPSIDGSGLFEPVQTSSFRVWQPMTQDSLRDLVVSRSNIALLTEMERARVLRKVDELYEGYGRGADGMLLPYLTQAFRATVRPQADPDPGPTAVGPDEVDTDALLIDFR